MRTKSTLLLILALLPFSVLLAQHWNVYWPFAGYAINTVDNLKPGYIVLGGGQEANDSIQIMFTSPDYGITWNENPKGVRQISLFILQTLPIQTHPVPRTSLSLKKREGKCKIQQCKSIKREICRTPEPE
jgi:hypothetical protein